MKALRFALLALAVLIVAQPARAANREGFVRASDGVRIHYVERGRGSPVVLLHGMTGSAASNYGQTGLIDVLARSHRVVAIDFRGHGRSDGPLEAAAYRPDRPSFAGIPVLQVLGRYDYPNTMSKLLKRDVADYQLVVLPGRTHLTALADPAFAAAVLAFVDARERR